MSNNNARTNETKILYDMFNYLVENDSDVRYAVNKIYKQTILKYVVENDIDIDTAGTIKNELDKIYTGVTDRLSGIRTMIIEDCYDDYYELPSRVFKVVFKSKVIDHLTPLEKCYDALNFLK